MDNGAVTGYSYDALGRLKTVSEPDGTQTAYTFDKQSNIQTKKITHPANYTFDFKKDGQDYAMSNLAVHSFTYAYDKNNRLKSENEYVGGSGSVSVKYRVTVKLSGGSLEQMGVVTARARLYYFEHPNWARF
jgi:YD repeat-containing protein